MFSLSIILPPYGRLAVLHYREEARLSPYHHTGSWRQALPPSVTFRCGLGSDGHCGLPRNLGISPPRRVIGNTGVTRLDVFSGGFHPPPIEEYNRWLFPLSGPRIPHLAAGHPPIAWNVCASPAHLFEEDGVVWREEKKGNKAAGSLLLEQMPRDLVSSNTKYNKIISAV